MNHIVALSGGKDSTAMALRLAEVEPREYLFVCTPTGDELPEMFDHWLNLGKLLGTPVLPVTSGMSLKGACAAHHSLPSWRVRFCTGDLKIAPFKRFLFANTPAVAYVGLRADEPEREGAQYGRPGSDGVYGSIEGIEQRYPLREWGWGINEVRAYLRERGVTIPRRTDCARCFFQREAEWWQLWRDHPETFADAEAQEAEYGHTFRSPGKSKRWPSSLRELRERFEAGDVPRGAGQDALFSDDREDMCRVCRL